MEIQSRGHCFGDKGCWLRSVQYLTYSMCRRLLLHGLQTASENSLGHEEHQRFLSTMVFFLPLYQKGQIYVEFSSQQPPTWVQDLCCLLTLLAWSVGLVGRPCLDMFAICVILHFQMVDGHRALWDVQRILEYYFCLVASSRWSGVSTCWRLRLCWNLKRLDGILSSH